MANSTAALFSDPDLANIAKSMIYFIMLVEISKKPLSPYEKLQMAAPAINTIDNMDYKKFARMAIHHGIPKQSGLALDALRLMIQKSTSSNDDARKINNIEIAENIIKDDFYNFVIKPILTEILSDALANYESSSIKNNTVSYMSKDVLQLDRLLNPSNASCLTWDGAVINELAQMSYTFLGDTFAGMHENTPTGVMKFLNEVYGLQYFNNVIIGQQYAYMYINHVGTSHMYRGANTKIELYSLKDNHNFLMGERGLYRNLPKIKPNNNRR